MKQAELVAMRYGIKQVYSNAEDLLANTEIEAIVAAQSFLNHAAIVPGVLAAGKHILTEKPLCIFAENGRKLAEAARIAGKIHMVAYHKRSDPAIEYAKEVIARWNASGELGKLTYLRITMPPGDWISGADKPVKTDEAYGVNTPEASPDGIDDQSRSRLVNFVNYYIHQINLMRFLMGEDYRLTFADRAGVLLAAESVTGITGILEMAAYKTTDDWQESVLVCFEKGWIRVDLPAPLASQRAGKVTMFDNSSSLGVYTSPVLPNVCAMRNQAMNFIKAIAGEKPAPCISSEAVKDLEIAMDYIRMTDNWL
jgi:predicted dehydrogenase